MRIRPVPLAVVVVALAACDPEPVPSGAPVRINELVASNIAGELRDDGAFPDWLELVNVTDDDVDLGGASLTDDAAVPRKGLFPEGTTLPAGARVVLWADGEGLRPDALPFRLSAAGEELLLFGVDGEVWDEVVFGAVDADVAWARLPDAEGDFQLDPTPTPGAPNE